MSTDKENLERVLRLLNEELASLPANQLREIAEQCNESSGHVSHWLKNKGSDLSRLHALFSLLFKTSFRSLPPETKSWIESRLTNEEIAAALQEFQSQEGPLLEDVIRELEQEKGS
jgi:hypothetical protein